jgi:hypothetical protein
MQAPLPQQVFGPMLLLSVMLAAFVATYQFSLTPSHAKINHVREPE